LKKPGKKYPKSWVKGSTPPFKMIYSLPDKWGRSVLVGMVGFNRTDPVPGLHEHGGFKRTTVRIPKKVKGRKRKGQPARYYQIRKRVRYPRRAFMQPALERTKTKLPHLWKDSIR
jgi:hypothetical protein